MKNYKFDSSNAAIHLNDILYKSSDYIRKRISNKIRKYYELINSAKDSPPKIKNIVHDYILKQTSKGIVGATDLENSLYRNVVITKSKRILKSK